MHREMAAADVVVCRAGATTLAELAAAGQPAILVPLPTATDDHQRVNAAALGGAGRGGAASTSATLDGERLAREIAALAGDAAARARAWARRRGGWRGRRGRRDRRTHPGTGRCVRGLMLGPTKRVHFVGIGGIGMSGIAELLANLGYEVSGSDAQAIGRHGAARARVRRARARGPRRGARRRRRRRRVLVRGAGRTTRSSSKRAAAASR